MKRTGIVHAQLAARLAGLRHTETFVVSDAGLPVPLGMPVVDLGYRYGQPGFRDVTATVLAEVVVEHSWASRDVVAANPDVWAFLQGTLDAPPELIDHEDFKARCARARFLIRTGEDTVFANLLCRAGVPFGPG